MKHMETSFQTGQAGQPNQGASKFQILAAFDATKEFRRDRGNGNRFPYKCAPTAQVIAAVSELGLADGYAEERVSAGIEYATQFRDTYEALASAE